MITESTLKDLTELAKLFKEDERNPIKAITDFFRLFPGYSALLTRTLL
jgi:hypothetical protein